MDKWGKPLAPYCTKCGKPMEVRKGPIYLWWECPANSDYRWTHDYQSLGSVEELPSIYDPNTGELIV